LLKHSSLGSWISEEWKSCIDVLIQVEGSYDWIGEHISNETNCGVQVSEINAFGKFKVEDFENHIDQVCEHIIIVSVPNLAIVLGHISTMNNKSWNVGENEEVIDCQIGYNVEETFEFDCNCSVNGSTCGQYL